MIEKGADINQATPDGETPLCVAAHNGYLDIVNFLIQKKADINQALLDGTTPLAVAKEQGHMEIVELLKKAGAKK